MMQGIASTLIMRVLLVLVQLLTVTRQLSFHYILCCIWQSCLSMLGDDSSKLGCLCHILSLSYGSVCLCHIKYMLRLKDSIFNVGCCVAGRILVIVTVRVTQMGRPFLNHGTNLLNIFF